MQCEYRKTHWNKIRLESVGFSKMKISETTFTNLKFSKRSPSSIGNLEASIKVDDFQTFNEAIKKLFSI